MALSPITSKHDIYQRRESAVRSYCRSFPETFVKAEGATLWADEDRAYLDFLAGCSSLNYGHNHPDLTQALVDYIQSGGIAHGLDMHTSAKTRFLQTFERLILKPRGMDYRLMFPGPTGANAVEAALKIARKVTGRHNVVAFTNGFHGMTLGALACTGNSSKRDGAGTPLSGVTHEPYDGYFGPNIDTAAQLEKRLADPSSGLDAPAAILLETVQGEGGLNVASPKWLQTIARIAKKHGALLIVDDIQAGCGRTGSFFSFEQAGIKPDIVTLAKSLSGMGLPFALTLISPEHDIWKPGEHNGTFRGNNHAFVTGAKALELFWADTSFEKDIQDKAAFLKRRLTQMAAKSHSAKSVKGRGMMCGIEFADTSAAEEICARCFENGLVIETSGARDNVVKILCPLTISTAELELGLNVLESAISQIETETRTAA